MMSWQVWGPPAGWPEEAPPVRRHILPLDPGHEASLWLFQLDDPAWDSPALTACLSEGELAQASRFRQPLHARRHRVARSVVRHLLGHLCGREASELVWQVGAHGKPHLPERKFPTASRAPLFNLSHSGGWALLASSFTLELGVDLEARDSRAHLMDMAHRILSSEEHNPQDGDSEPGQRLDSLLRAWTRKEACLKALGTGLSRDMDSLTLTGSGARTASAHLATHGRLPPLGWADLRLPPDCRARGACAWLQTGADRAQ